jgi:hypothetical protein
VGDADRRRPAGDGVRVGYAVLGRTMKFQSVRWGFQGDAEKPNLLGRLARRNPDVEWVVVGHNDADERPLDLPNVVNPWFGARERAAALPPRTDGYYRTPFDPYWTAKPAWWCSEVTGFEDWLVELISDLDGVVLHVGQHAPTQLRIPQATRTWHETFTNPNLDGNRVYDSMQAYCRYLVRGLNALGDKTLGRAPVVWLVPDPRNYLKARDVKWPTGTDDMLAQAAFKRSQRHERYGDHRAPEALGFRGVQLERPNEVGEHELWSAQHAYRHADLELMILPDDWERLGTPSFADRTQAGVATTSTKASVLGEGRRRSRLVSDYLLAAFPAAEVYGKWDDASLADVPDGTVRATTPDEFYGLLERFRITLSLPIVESGWSVAKAYQCWAANSVCFYVEQVDEQGWTLPSRRQAPGTREVGRRSGTPFYSTRDDWTDDDLTLAAWLRVETPDEFARRARAVTTDAGTWRWLVNAQRTLLRRRWDDKLLERTIEERLGIDQVELAGVDAGAAGGVL